MSQPDPPSSDDEDRWSSASDEEEPEPEIPPEDIPGMGLDRDDSDGLEEIVWIRGVRVELEKEKLTLTFRIEHGKGHIMEFYLSPLGHVRHCPQTDVLRRVLNVSFINGAVRYMFESMGDEFFATDVLDIQLADQCDKNFDEDTTEEMKEVKEQFIKELVAHFSALPHRVKAEKFCLAMYEKEEDVLRLLPYIEPGTLKSITLVAKNRRGPFATNDIAEMEQWKKAKELTALDMSVVLNIDNWLHFDKCDVHGVKMTFETFMTILENYKERRNVHRSSLSYIATEEERNEMRNYMNQFPREGNFRIIDSGELGIIKVWLTPMQIEIRRIQ